MLRILVYIFILWVLGGIFNKITFLPVGYVYVSVCLLVAFVLSKCKNWHYRRNVKEIQKHIKDTIGDELGGMPSIIYRLYSYTTEKNTSMVRRSEALCLINEF